MGTNWNKPDPQQRHNLAWGRQAVFCLLHSLAYSGLAGRGMAQYNRNSSGLRVQADSRLIGWVFGLVHLAMVAIKPLTGTIFIA